MFSVHIGLTKEGKTKFKTTFGGCYTILMLLLTLVYAIIIIIEPLKASSSTIHSTVETYTTNVENSAGSISSEKVTINGVEFSGTNEVK